jgi:hypothetical protein
MGVIVLMVGVGVFISSFKEFDSENVRKNEGVIFSSFDIPPAQWLYQTTQLGEQANIKTPLGSTVGNGVANSKKARVFSISTAALAPESSHLPFLTNESEKTQDATKKAIVAVKQKPAHVALDLEQDTSTVQLDALTHPVRLEGLGNHRWPYFIHFHKAGGTTLCHQARAVNGMNVPLRNCNLPGDGPRTLADGG